MSDDPLRGKRLVILGLARQGTALARFACARGAQVVVSDLGSAEALAPALAELAGLPIAFVLGSHPLSLLDGADYLAISGGVPLDAPIVTAALARGIPLTNDSLEFTRRCPAPSIGVTGSAGKSTTTALTGAMARADGRTTWVGGNLGRPLIADLEAIRPTDLVVQELSSFQLDQWTVSPPIAAVLNITPNHLDRHRTMAAYTAAKANILCYQRPGDTAVLPLRNLEQLVPLTAARVRFFSMDEPVADGACVRGGQIVLRDGDRERPVCPVEAIRLRGLHNRLNVLAAVALADSAGVGTAAMQAAVRQFTGIEHRLEPVGVIDGVQYINDSIATAPERALAALGAFHEPLILLAGGRDKDLQWEVWAERVAQRVRTAILFGELAAKLQPILTAVGAPDVRRVADLESAVALAHALAQPGDVVLLAPGGTSFDAYRDFAARGDHFRRLVQQWASAEVTAAP